MTTFDIYGKPAPQGSKRAFVNSRTGRAQVVESSANVRPWRQAVTHAAMESGVSIPLGDVTVLVTFYLPRPKGHYRTGKRANELRDSAPFRPATKPDLDKLLRATLDGLTDAGAFTDDAQVATLTAGKRYADDRPPGARVTIVSGIPFEAAP